MTTEFAAVILAGGAARRLGGADKPAMSIAGIPMIQRVLAAACAATITVVVGPAGLPVPPDVPLVQEQPPGGGPVAALAAAMPSGPDDSWPALTAVLAGDLPLLTPEAVEQLVAAIAGHDGAVFVDDDGQEQWLCGLWRSTALTTRLRALPGVANQSLRRLLRDVDAVPVRATTDPPPWFDCDTEDDIRRAEEWLGR